MPYYMEGEGCTKDFSKWRPEILHEIEYLVFTIIMSFSEKKCFNINISLFTSVVCYCQNGLRRTHGKCSLCNEWWHSFMNQRLNHLVLLYEKCNCIRIMSLNKNVDIIWHYCIISQIKSWFLKTISSHKYEERRIEVYDK